MKNLHCSIIIISCVPLRGEVACNGNTDQKSRGVASLTHSTGLLVSSSVSSGLTSHFSFTSSTSIMACVGCFIGTFYHQMPEGGSEEPSLRGRVLIGHKYGECGGQRNQSSSTQEMQAVCNISCSWPLSSGFHLVTLAVQFYGPI